MLIAIHRLILMHAAGWKSANDQSRNVSGVILPVAAQRRSDGPGKGLGEGADELESESRVPSHISATRARGAVLVKSIMTRSTSYLFGERKSNVSGAILPVAAQ
jgi:hypothetical protein